MKLGFIFAAAAASAFAAHSVIAAPFSAPQSVVATKAGYKSIQYTVKKGETLKGIKVPVVNRPVHMIVTDTTPYYTGVGELAITAFPGTTMMWTGTDLASDGKTAIDYGSSQGPGTHMMWADYASTVDVQVQDQKTIQIKNKSGEAQTVIVTFMW